MVKFIRLKNISNFNTIFLIFGLLFFFQGNGGLAQAQKVNISSIEISEEYLPQIKNELKYYQETGLRLTPDKAIDIYKKGQFKPVQGNIFNQPYTLHQLWLGLSVKNLFNKSIDLY